MTTTVPWLPISRAVVTKREFQLLISSAENKSSIIPPRLPLVKGGDSNSPFYEACLSVGRGDAGGLEIFAACACLLLKWLVDLGWEKSFTGDLPKD
jgi:hypothetical protein